MARGVEMEDLNSIEYLPMSIDRSFKGKRFRGFSLYASTNRMHVR